MMARLAVSGRETTARAAKTRKVVERVSSRPPPKAEEEIAVMVGIGRLARLVYRVRREVRKVFVLFVSERERGISYQISGNSIVWVCTVSVIWRLADYSELKGLNIGDLV